jgi:RNA polymerase sigma-70 factor (ECF subfamily)
LEDPDLPLVQALQAGEDRALDSLMNRHREGLFQFVFRHIPNEADAQELSTETFVRAYFKIGNFRPTAKFSTWLYHIALNLCRDHLKSRAYRHSLHTVSIDAPAQEDGEPSQFASAQRSPGQEAERLEELGALEKAINELPEHLKHPLVLKALENHSLADTAERLGLSLHAVGMRVYRARKMLSQKMSKMGF